MIENEEAAKLRALFLDAMGAAPAAPTVAEIEDARARRRHRRSARRWVSGAAVGLVAASTIALFTVPNLRSDLVRRNDVDEPSITVVRTEDASTTEPAPLIAAPTSRRPW